MTKERDLLFKIVETLGNAAISSAEREQWLKDYAKQQAIAFANHIAYNDFKPHDIDTWNGGKHSTHELYDDFIEHQRIENQFIEQQNK